jgi:hypothetical protein
MIAVWRDYSGRAYVRMSSDDGASWSAKAALLGDYPDAVLDDLQLTAGAGVAAIAVHVANESSLGAAGVYVLRAALE